MLVVGKGRPKNPRFTAETGSFSPDVVRQPSWMAGWASYSNEKLPVGSPQN